LSVLNVKEGTTQQLKTRITILRDWSLGSIVLTVRNIPFIGR